MPVRPMEPADIRKQVVLEEHDLTADGSFAVVVKRFVHGNAYASELWLVPLSPGGRERRLSAGRVRDTRPRISPDGRRVAFIRRDLDGSERPGRLMLLRIAGSGRATPAVPGNLAVADHAWSPTGDRLALTAEVGAPRFLVGPKPRGKETPLARRIRRIDWRYDDVGHVDRWEHLFVVDVGARSRAVQLTEGDHRVEAIAWRPDGRAIAFSADPRPDADVHPRTTIWAVDVPRRGSRRMPEPREILSLDGWATSPAWSPDGRLVVAVGVDVAEPTDEISPGLFVGPADGSRAAVALAADLDRPVGDWVDTDLEGWMAASRRGPVWPVADRIVTTISDRGRSRPWGC